MEKRWKVRKFTNDIPELLENKRLVVTRGGSIMMEGNVYSDLIDLLTERMEIKVNILIYLNIYFRKLTNLSGLQPRK